MINNTFNFSSPESLDYIYTIVINFIVEIYVIVFVPVLNFRYLDLFISYNGYLMLDYLYIFIFDIKQ